MNTCSTCKKQHDAVTKTCERCKARSKQNKLDNPERTEASRQRWREKNPHYKPPYKYEAYYGRHESIRAEVIYVLGGRCVGPKCKWLNEDGTIGCADSSILQIDHVNGGGGKERKKLPYYKLYKKLLENQDGYQLLCANCNWRKRTDRAEVRQPRRDRIVPRSPVNA